MTPPPKKKHWLNMRATAERRRLVLSVLPGLSQPGRPATITYAMERLMVAGVERLVEQGLVLAVVPEALLVDTVDLNDAAGAMTGSPAPAPTAPAAPDEDGEEAREGGEPEPDVAPRVAVPFHEQLGARTTPTKGAHRRKGLPTARFIPRWKRGR